ncbi:hypothetical protein CI610_02229 [invertebrate metagenome]|uniref:Uncharacterized protein n=1 Tax=invertebrate metagenome TaxID=1711999 RepID=A0A2H9T6G5_9ZZZZ
MYFLKEQEIRAAGIILQEQKGIFFEKSINASKYTVLNANSFRYFLFGTGNNHAYPLFLVNSGKQTFFHKKNMQNASLMPFYNIY